MTETPLRDKARRDLLAAALPHVAFDGWSRQALDAGARDAGMLPGDVPRLFPKGAADAVSLFIAETDAAMEARLADAAFEGLRMHERVRAALLARFDIVAPHREAVRRAVAFLALPRNAALAARTLARTVDCIWHAAGDRAADFSYYTKRATLAAVYSATLLYWLTDEGAEPDNLAAFLDRRLADVMRLHEARTAWQAQLRHLPDPFRLIRAFREQT